MSVYTLLILGGIFGHLLMRVSGDVPVLFKRLCRRGEAGTSGTGEGSSGGDGSKGGVKFDAEQQKHVDAIVESRLRREREKYADYEDLRKFKTEFEKQQDAKAQKELEEQKKYDEAKKSYETQINQHKEVLTKKEQEILDLKISHQLINEITRQNGYAEEAMALLKSSTKVDDKGNIIISGKDANGIDTQLPVAEGVKKFLESRPYLVKSTHKAGAGTSAAQGSSSGGEGGAVDHNTLNKEYMMALNSGDSKKAREIKTKINAVLAMKGVSV